MDISSYLEKIKYDVIDDVRRMRCVVRRKWYVITPEETVRQCCLHHLIACGYSPKLLSVEKQIVVNQLKRRFDILVYDQRGKPIILVECKAPSVSLSQVGLDQVYSYNHKLGVSYIWYTNGHDHRIYTYEEDGQVKSVDSLPRQS